MEPVVVMTILFQITIERIVHWQVASMSASITSSAVDQHQKSFLLNLSRSRLELYFFNNIFRKTKISIQLVKYMKAIDTRKYLNHFAQHLRLLFLVFMSHKMSG